MKNLLVQDHNELKHLKQYVRRCYPEDEIIEVHNAEKAYINDYLIKSITLKSVQHKPGSD